MNQSYSMLRMILLLLFLYVAAACSSSGAVGNPADAVEGYLQALVSRDSNRMIANSCAEWESNARLEHDAFAAVTLELRDVACSQTDEQDEAAVVSCSGSILANYGAEDLEIDVAERSYRVILEDGEWRMCGYAIEP